MLRFFSRVRFRLRGRLEDVLFFCFLAGLLAGTAAANYCFPSFGEEASHYLGLLKQNAQLGGTEAAQLFFVVFRQRLLEVFIAWLLGLTIYAVPCFCFLSGALGLSMGMVLSILTGQKGLMGLPVFFMTLMPQAFCYLPVWAILLYWVKRQGKRFKLPALLLLFALAALGSACEVWLNPWFLGLVL